MKENKQTNSTNIKEASKVKEAKKEIDHKDRLVNKKGIIALGIGVLALTGILVGILLNAPKPNSPIEPSPPQQPDAEPINTFYNGSSLPPSDSCLILENLVIRNSSINYSLWIGFYTTVIIQNVTIQIESKNLLVKDALFITNVKHLLIFNCTFNCSDGVILKNVQNSSLSNCIFIGITGLSAENSNCSITSNVFFTNLAIRSIENSRLNVTQNRFDLFESLQILNVINSTISLYRNVYRELGMNFYSEFNSEYYRGYYPVEIGGYIDSEPLIAKSRVSTQYTLTKNHPSKTNLTNTLISFTLNSRILSSLSLNSISLNRTLDRNSGVQSFIYNCSLTPGNNILNYQLTSSALSESNNFTIFYDRYAPVFTPNIQNTVFGESVPSLGGTVFDDSFIFVNIRINSSLTYSSAINNGQFYFTIPNWTQYSNSSQLFIQFEFRDEFWNTAIYNFTISKLVLVPVIELIPQKNYFNSNFLANFTFSAFAQYYFVLNNHVLYDNYSIWEHENYSRIEIDSKILIEGLNNLTLVAHINGTARSMTREFIFDSIAPNFMIINITRTESGVLIEGTVSEPVIIYINNTRIAEFNSTTIAIIAPNSKIELLIIDLAGNQQIIILDLTEPPHFELDLKLLLMGAFGLIALVVIVDNARIHNIKKKLNKCQMKEVKFE